MELANSDSRGHANKVDSNSSLLGRRPALETPELEGMDISLEPSLNENYKQHKCRDTPGKNACFTAVRRCINNN